jgi:hypothetical protein
MGMMLRRNGRKPDYAPQVNGKPVVPQPKKKKLTENKNGQGATYDPFKNLK